MVFVAWRISILGVQGVMCRNEVVIMKFPSPKIYENDCSHLQSNENPLLLLLLHVLRFLLVLLLLYSYYTPTTMKMTTKRDLCPKPQNNLLVLGVILGIYWEIGKNGNYHIIELHGELLGLPMSQTFVWRSLRPKLQGRWGWLNDLHIMRIMLL